VSVEAAPQRTAALDAFGQSFKRALAALRRLRGRETRQQHGLSDAQYSLLFCIRDENEMSSTELAEAADLSPATVTEMLEGLGVEGLVQRIRSDRDRRIVLTTLTERGRKLVEERRARVEPRFREAMAEFSDQDLVVAAAVLDRLRGLFDDLAEDR
jgi:DNA-binding MarR family transcriptional regulator